MGFDYGIARHYKNGQIDRKAECDARLTWENENKKVSVVKSSMVGSEYYAAVRIEEKNKFPFIIGTVIQTAVDGREIGMKIVEETCGPIHYKCPKGILELLSPTDSESATEWRKKCREYHEKKARSRKDKYSLKNLPVGTTIDFIASYDMSSGIRKGQHVTLEKKILSWKYVWDGKTGEHKRKERIGWSDGYYRWPEKLIPEDYRIMTDTQIIDKQSRDMLYEEVKA